ncbi:MAG: hypothetical protein ACR2KZ_04345, partial [Segetibacter sp.]
MQQFILHLTAPLYTTPSPLTVFIPFLNELAQLIITFFLKKNSSLILSLLSGLLLVSAWPDAGFTVLIFVAWVPLLLLADRENNRIRFFLFALLSMFIWNAGTTWWIWNATGAGAIAAIIANSFLMAIPLWGFHTFKTKYGDKSGLLSLIVFWLSFEYVHLNWQLSWPWLTLGNVFSTKTNWVQWYEFTGVGGGSLWVLLTNVLIFLLIKTRRKANLSILLATVAVLLLPVGLSYLVHPQKTE